MLIVGVGLGLLGGLFAIFLMAMGGRSLQSARLQEVMGEAAARRGAMATAAGTPRAGWAHPLGVVGGWWGGKNPELARRMALAGYRKPHQVEIFSGVRLLLPIGLGLAIAYAMPDNLFVWLMMAVVAGFLGPDMWLNRAVEKRRRAIGLSLPDMLDLLSICMQAGLGLDQAILRVGQEISLSHPALSEELMQLGREQRAGSARIAAWRDMAERVKLDSVRSFVNMLAQTERFGTPVSRSLSVFSDSLRTKRRQQAEEAAAKTTIKMVMPLVLFIFPTVFIVTVAPAALRIAENFGRLI